MEEVWIWHGGIHVILDAPNPRPGPAAAAPHACEGGTGCSGRPHLPQLLKPSTTDARLLGQRRRPSCLDRRYDDLDP